MGFWFNMKKLLGTHKFGTLWHPATINFIWDGYFKVSTTICVQWVQRKKFQSLQLRIENVCNLLDYVLIPCNLCVWIE